MANRTIAKEGCTEISAWGWRVLESDAVNDRNIGSDTVIIETELGKET